MLTRLDGILFCGQAVGVVSHGVEDIEALQTLVAGIDVAGDVAEGMSHVQTCAAGIGEHVQDIELLAVLVFCYLVCLPLSPELVPFLLDFPEIIFSCHLAS